MEEKQLNERELERLKKIYPLFKMDLEGKVLTVHLSKSSSFSPWMKDGKIDHEAHQMLDRCHMISSMNTSLMALYPDLYISTYPDKDGCKVSVWVNRPRDSEADDAESIGDVDICDSDLHNQLYNWQLEAAKAKQKGWFFCSGHGRAEHKWEGHYFHFASNYCKQWGEEHPDSRKAAARENYE